MTILQDISLADANPNYSINTDYDSVLTNNSGETIIVGSTNYWSLEKNTNIYTLYLQKYNSDGTTNGNAVTFHTEATFDAIYYKAASTLENGNVVVIWKDSKGNYVTQEYTEDGVAASSATTLDTVAGGALSDNRFEIVPLDNGGYAITSHELIAANTYRVTAQIYDAEGNRTTDAFTITPNATGSNSSNYDVAAVNGGFVVMVTSDNQDSDGTPGVIGAVYANDGTQLVAEFPANSTAAGEQAIEDIATLANGGYAVTWKMYDENSNVSSLFTRVFDAEGNPVAAESVSGSISGDYDPYISETVALSDGSFAVIWAEANEEWTEYTFKSQLFDANGNPTGGIVDLAVTDYADSVKISETENGVLTISYTGYPAAGGEERTVVTAAIYNAPIGLAISADTIAEDASPGTIVGALNATDADGDDIAWALTDDADGRFSLVTENGVTYVVVKGQLDYETAATQQIKVSATDGTYTTVKTLQIHVSDVDENGAPTDIAISNTTMKESARAGFEVGVLSATDPDGDAITWSLVAGQGDNDNNFKLRTNDDGSVSVVLKNPLNHESVGGGVYDLVVKATDSNGHETISTIEITAEDDPLKFSGSPTGKDYTAVVENTKVGQEIGYLSAFDGDFDIASATLIDDADGAFKITSRTVEGVTRYYLATAKKLDHETLDSHSVTFQATDTNGNTYQKTIDVNVLDAAETGDTARGRITIDAATALAGKNGGVNWNTYLADYHDKLSAYLPAFLPNGTGWSQSNPSSEFLFGNGESFLSMRGSNFVYNWTDPVTGEDAHVVSGDITDLVFGAGKDTGSDIGITKAELTISGLDLSNDSTPLNRIFGEVNVLASACMHGLDAGYPAEIEYVKALLASYAQTFNGSAKADTYTGTIFNDIVRGNNGADKLNGGAGNDKLWGGNGADIIKGGAGNDHLYGGAASDKLYGNAGADTFHFTAISESRKNAFDTIYDFDGKGGDKIDLSDIDANSGRGGNQAFTFIGSQDFHKRAGELHFDKIKGDTVIEGDVNGDGKADFVLHLDDAMSLKADYFIL